MAAQQKPKVTKGTTNPGRRNGKANKTRVKVQCSNGGTAGYSADRVAQMAADRGVTYDQMVIDLKDRQKGKRLTRKLIKASRRRNG